MSHRAISGIHAALCTVSGFALHEALFCEALGWHVASTTSLAPTGVNERFGMDTSARVVRLQAPGAISGDVWLIEFVGLRPESLGHPPVRVTGFFAIDVYVRDLDHAIRRIEAVGARCAGTAAWQIPTPAGAVTVRQAKIDGPDDVTLVLVCPEKPRYTATWTLHPEAIATELTSVVVGSQDVEQSKAFWGHTGLGLPIVYDAEFAQPEMCRMCGIEEDSAFRMAFGVSPGTARLEIVGRANDSHAGIVSLDLASRQRPGRSLGQGAWVVKVADVDAALAIARARGGSVLRGAATLTSLAGPNGRGERGGAVLSPEGVWIELIEGE